MAKARDPVTFQTMFNHRGYTASQTIFRQRSMPLRIFDTLSTMEEDIPAVAL